MKNIYTLKPIEKPETPPKTEMPAWEPADIANLDKTASGNPRQALVDLFDSGYLQEDPSKPGTFRLTFQAEGILRAAIGKEDNTQQKKHQEPEDEAPRGDAGFSDAMNNMYGNNPQKNKGWEYPEWDN